MHTPAMGPVRAVHRRYGTPASASFGSNVIQIAHCRGLSRTRIALSALPELLTCCNAASVSVVSYPYSFTM